MLCNNFVCNYYILSNVHLCCYSIAYLYIYWYEQIKDLYCSFWKLIGVLHFSLVLLIKQAADILRNSGVKFSRIFLFRISQNWKLKVCPFTTIRFINVTKTEIELTTRTINSIWQAQFMNLTKLWMFIVTHTKYTEFSFISLNDYCFQTIYTNL